MKRGAEEPMESRKEEAQGQKRPRATQAAEAAGLGERIYALLDSRKAQDLLLLDLTEVNPYFRTFLIATATSQVHLKALVRDVLREFGPELPKTGPSTRPDEAESGWVIVDFIDVVAHLFVKELREFYNLERLWGDGRILKQSGKPGAT